MPNCPSFPTTRIGNANFAERIHGGWLARLATDP